MATDNEKLESQIIDWDSFDELPEGEQSQLDPEADAFEQVAPPKPGVYTFRVAFAPDNPQVKYTERGKPYYSARLELTLLSDNPDLDGAKVYPTVTTLVGRGKNISTMATLMIKGGGKLTSNNATDKQVMTDFRKWILSEPTVQAEVDWQVGYTESDGKTWITKYSSYKNIPNDPATGDKQFRFEFRRKDDSLVQTGAMLQTKTFFAKGQTPKPANSPVNGTAANASAKGASEMPRVKPQIEDDDEIAELESQIASKRSR